MATPVEAPKLGNTRRRVPDQPLDQAQGRTVAAGDVVAEIETDKATFEVTSPVDGVLLESFFDEGALVPVFTNIFVVGDAGETVEEFRPGEPLPSRGRNPQLSALAPRPGAPQTPTTSPQPAATQPAGPPLRRPAQLPPLRRHRLRPQRPRPRSRPRGPLPVGPRISKLRERIARRMRESLSGTAQYTLNASADARGLLAIRSRTKAVNINHLVTFCCVEALLDVPSVNAEFVDGAIREHADVHIGFACDTPRGLLVPVVRDAHLLAVDELAARMQELAGQAVDGTISPDDLSGATFTVSNLGALGIETFTPLLNPPQVAILGVGAIQVKPVRRGGQVEFIDTIGLSLTCDHQIIDGAPGARFLQVLKSKIEDVESFAGL